MPKAELAFQYPWLMLGLLPGLFLAFLPRGQTRWEGAGWASVVERQLQSHVLQQPSDGLLRRWSMALAHALSFIAASGPVLVGSAPDVAWRADSARVVVVDLSTSDDQRTDQEDQTRRLQGALTALFARMPSGETALMVYGAEEYLVVPFTHDPKIASRFIPEIKRGIIPAPGDDPLRAISAAARLLGRSAASTKEIIWVTGRRLHPNALSSELLIGARLIVLHLSDPADFFHPVLASGGVVITADQDGFSKLVDIVSPDQWVERSTGRRQVERPLWPYLILLALPLFALGIGRAPGGGGLALVLILHVAAFLGPDDAWAVEKGPAADQVVQARQLRPGATDQDEWRMAIAAFRSGRFDDAAQIWAATGDDPDSRYNRGTALAMGNRLEEALQVLGAALTASPNDVDARHNYEVVRDLLERGKKKNNSQEPKMSEVARNSDEQREAEILAEQWLRRLPEDLDGLLPRLLKYEHRRRVRSSEGGGE